MTITRAVDSHHTRIEEVSSEKFMDSDLSLDFLRVVEQAAIACAQTMGQRDALSERRNLRASRGQ